MRISVLYWTLESEASYVSCFAIKYIFVYMADSSVLFRIYASVSTCVWCCSELCMKGNKLSVLVVCHLSEFLLLCCQVWNVFL